jgi:predicted nucleic acid-binding protein
MEHLFGFANVNVEEAGRVALALNLLGQGLDFADALHLAASAHCEALYTFDDGRFARRAQSESHREMAPWTNRSDT